uniref:Protein cereblon n=1 Tax=Steinernema glaseri TaxID=37863 RepID=A0A1I7YF94_9BILA
MALVLMSRSPSPNPHAPTYDPRKQDLHGYRRIPPDLIQCVGHSGVQAGERFTVPGFVSDLVIFPHQAFPFYVNSPSLNAIKYLLKQVKSGFPYIVAIPDVESDDEDEEEDDELLALRSKRGTLVKIGAYAQDSDEACHLDGHAVARVRIHSVNYTSREYMPSGNLSFVSEVVAEVLSEPIPSNYFRNIFPHYLAIYAANHPNQVEPWIRAVTNVGPSLVNSCGMMAAQRELQKMLFKYYPSEKAAFVDNYNLADKSFWFAQNFPSDSKWRKKLLDEDCPAYRLIMIHKAVELFKCVSCANCGSSLTDPLRDAMVMSTEGSSALYMNPGGHIHDMFFVRREKEHALVANGHRHATFSWFEGYSWRCMMCTGCYQHVGWEFTSEVINPPKFIAFTRYAITMELNPQEEPEL